VAEKLREPQLEPAAKAALEEEYVLLLRAMTALGRIERGMREAAAVGSAPAAAAAVNSEPEPADGQDDGEPPAAGGGGDGDVAGGDGDGAGAGGDSVVDDVTPAE
jgi:hypothetical protein